MTQILYATNRNRKTDAQPPKFGGSLSDEIHYGYCEGGKAHSLPVDEFLRRIQNVLSQGGDVLNFLHGYCADFEATLGKAEKVAKEYAKPANGRERLVVVFSWPSVGKLFGIGTDFQNATASGGQIAAVLKSQLDLPSAENAIHLISQSFGNVALNSTVQALAKLNANLDVKLAEVVMTAPVLPEDAFADPKQLLPLPAMAKRITVYYNPSDFGQLFQWVLSEPAKMQYQGPDRTSLPEDKVVVVNAEKVLGVHHQYYLYVEKVVQDILATINGVDAGDSELKRCYVEAMKHYELLP